METLFKWCTENIDSDFLNKYWDYQKNTYNPCKIAVGSRKKVWIKCQNCDYHDSYELYAYALKQGTRCPYCAGKTVHALDSFGYKYEQAVALWSQLNSISPFDISYGSGKDIYIKCINEIHEDYKTKPYRAKEHYFQCPKCSNEMTKSYLQEKVESYLRNKYKFKINTEESCSIVPVNPKRIKNSNMPYDIEVKELKLIIEVNGEQHYNITGWTKKHAERNNTSAESELKKRKLYDRYKRYVAHVNKYNFLTIPYWFEFQDSYKGLIDCKIMKIILKSPTLCFGDFYFMATPFDFSVG